MTQYDNQEPMDLLDEEAIRNLALQTLEKILSPNPDWLERHKEACLFEDPPRDSDIESMIEDLTPSVETEEGTIHAELDHRKVQTIGRDLGDAFQEAEERLETLKQENQQDFLSAFEQSVRWSVTNQLVDHPDLDVARWMEMAESLDLAVPARDILMNQGGPEDLGRWWKYARPLEDNWSRAYYTFRSLPEYGKFELARKWLTPLAQAHLPEPEDAQPPRMGRGTAPLATTQYRGDALDSMWAHQVSRYHARTSSKERLSFIRALEEKGAGDMLLLDWKVLLGGETSHDTLASPETVRERLTHIALTHPNAYAKWIENPSTAPKQAKKIRIATTQIDSQRHLDLESVAQALKGAGPDDFISVMAVVSEKSRNMGLEDGYEAQAVASLMDVTLTKDVPTAPRQRF